ADSTVADKADRKSSTSASLSLPALDSMKNNYLLKSFAHNLDLVSAYADYTPAGEPAFTNFTPKFKGTLDYCFYSRAHFTRTARRPIMSEDEAKKQQGGLPNLEWPSDHVWI